MEKTPFNININGTTPDIDNEKNDFKDFKDYIIVNNKFLINENNSLRIKLDELNKDKSEQEDEIDKYDEKIRYMRGLLQNLYLLKEKSTILKNKWEKHTKNYCKIIDKYSHVNGIFNFNIYTLLIFYFLHTIYTKTISSLLLFIVYQFISLFFINIQQKIINKNIKISFFKNKNIITMNLNNYIETYNNDYLILLTENKNSVKEIEDLERGTLGVSHLIDNI